MKHKLFAAGFAAVSGLFWWTSACAVQVVPVSYAAPNGFTGTFTYFDESYSGAGCKTCDGAALSGGLGDLTDGVIASGNWNIVEAPAGPGPYVGWFGINPTITFAFAGSVAIDSATFYFDDASNNGVSPPLSVVINGQTFAVSDPPANTPFSFTVSSLGFVGSSLPVTLMRNGNWVFASEVRFDSAAVVPEASTLTMLTAGGVFLGVALRRRRPG